MENSECSSEKELIERSGLLSSLRWPILPGKDVVVVGGETCIEAAIDLFNIAKNAHGN